MGEKLCTSPEIMETVQAVVSLLDGEHYAFSGGAAMTILGTKRLTGDVDIYTPPGLKNRFKRLLLRDPRFRDGARVTFAAQRTASRLKGVTKWFSKPEPATIDVPLDFGEHPVDEIVQYAVNGINILHPVIQLDRKCEINRSDNDQADIKFLAKWLVKHGFEVTRATVKQCYINALPQRFLKQAGVWAE